jgi:hypothetical protein
VWLIKLVKTPQRTPQKSPHERVIDIVKTVSRYRGRAAAPANNLHIAMFRKAPVTQSRNITVFFNIAYNISLIE